MRLTLHLPCALALQWMEARRGPTKTMEEWLEEQVSYWVQQARPPLQNRRCLHYPVSL